MIRPLKLRHLVVLLMGLALAAQEPSLIRAGRLLDVRTGQVQTDRGLLIQAGRIAASGPWAQVSASAPKGATVLDLSDQFVLPGLIEAHTHVLLQGNRLSQDYADQILKESVPYRTLRGAVAARSALLWGFTTLRDLGSEGAGYADVDLKKAIEAGVIPGPRLFVAGRAFSATGTYPLQNYAWELDLPSGVRVVDGVEPIRQAVRDEVRRGIDWVKVYVDRSAYLGDDGRLRSLTNYRPEELKAFVEEAHRLGKRTSAHVKGWDGIDAALTAGFDTLEHADGFTDDLLERALKQGTFWCPTIYAGVWVADGRGPLGHLYPKLLAAAFRKGLAKGVKIALGSDAGAFPWTENPAKELALMVDRGMTPLQALQSATLVAADLLGAKDLGTLEPGAHADLIALAEDPTKDITALQRLRTVVKGGAVIRGDRSRPNQ
ncbi:Xaa-Pro dipeptidase [Geothrix limicola]|uniref:Xaa-Pro dipeptidase n=1 Tax=Geothrix limicola TaxID=2927978 RepID=A0ABQ5QK61_9BACT|nr:amidohydrolase family protein [Geothrix limicola]GLH74987.1 Xaa-Pro dipeptidase [Geothrix limicola]